MATVAPTLVLAFLAAGYLLDCFWALFDPSRPLDVILPTEKGGARLRAARWSLDLARRRLVAYDVRLESPDGAPIASTEQVVALGPSVGRAGYDVWTRGLRANVERLADGTWRHLDLLPKEQKEPSKIAFAVHLEDAAVQFTDRTSREPWTRTVFVRDGRLAGAAGRYLASFDVDVQSVGRMKGHARFDPDHGPSYDVFTQRLALSPVLDHLREAWEGRRYEYLRELKGQDLTVSGQSHGAKTKGGGFGFRAQVVASGRNASYGPDFKAQEFQFKGMVCESGLRGALTFSDRGATGDAAGGVDWSKEVVASGRAHYAARNASALPTWLRNGLPSGIDFRDGEFDGWVSYGGARAYQADGRIAAAYGTWKTYRIDAPRFNLSTSPDRYSFDVQQATWLGSRVGGRVDVVRDRLSGMVGSKGLSLRQAARLLGRKDLAGSAEVTAILGGTVASPQAELRVGALASLVIPKRPETILGNIDAAGRYIGGQLVVDRLSMVGPNGVVTGRGVWDTRTNRISGAVRGDGLVVSAWEPGQEGTALVDARISGTVKAPKAAGRVELFGAVFRNRTIPFVGTDFDWDGARLLGKNVVVEKGVTSVRGTLAWRPKDDGLTGNFRATGVMVDDWMTGEYGGTLDVKSMQVGGTAETPLLNGSLEGRSLIAHGLAIDRFQSGISIHGNRTILQDLRMTMGKGELTGEGDYDWRTGTGRFAASATNVDIARLTSTRNVTDRLGDAAQSLKAGGSISADFSGTLVEERLENLKAEGSVRDASLNAALLGNGDWTIAKNGPSWSYTAQIGQIRGFVEIPEMAYNESTGDVRGRFLANRFSLQNVISGLSTLTERLAPETRSKLSSLDGAVNIEGAVSGQGSDPDVELTSFDIDGLKYLSQDAGKISAKATRRKGAWDVAKLDWDSNDGFLRAHGTVDEHGQVDIGGELKQFRLGALGLLAPDLATLPGTAELDFSASGPLEQPDVDASLTVQVLGELPDDPLLQAPVLFYLGLPKLELRNGFVRTAADEVGGLTFRGIPGKVTFSFPFDYRVGIPGDKPIGARIWLEKPRSLGDLAEYAPWLDTARSAGSVMGDITLSGTLDALVADGGITLDAERLAFKQPDPKRPIAARFESSLTDVHAALTPKDGGLDFDFSGQSSRGGTAKGRMRATDFDILEAVRGSTQKLQSTPIVGSLELLGFGMDLGVGDVGRFEFETDGRLGVTGTVRSPSIDGSLAFLGASGTAPSAFASATASEQPSINPRFDVSLRLAEGTHVRASPADVYVHGSGSLKGSLSRPNATAGLEVEKGNVRLPNARIRILEGGTMRFDYRVAQDGTANPRLDIDLNGETSVTALRFGNTLERYSISMRLTGNLLEDAPLNIAAHSDPPDLSHDRILAILGQSDLVKGLAQDGEKTLATYAVPAVIDPLTQRLATQLGLEYVNLEYDMWQRTTITAARSLGGGFTIMGRRQISSSTTSGPALFDYRITYRLPFAKGVWRSFSISFGADQDRPYKLSLEYGTRF